jgi:aminoglycoside 6'-N-acetyltransferase I
MRLALWPGAESEHAPYIDRYLAGDTSRISQVYLLVDDGDQPIGFVELFLRNYAEGSDEPLVPYVEGWFIDVAWRRKGGGRLLIERACQWARELGYAELASDALADNQASIRAHKDLGFREID